MFVHAIKGQKKGICGYNCALVESVRTNGSPGHKVIVNFGFVPADRVPYLKAAFNAGDPAEILEKELRKQAGKDSAVDNAEE